MFYRFPLDGLMLSKLTLLLNENLNLKFFIVENSIPMLENLTFLDENFYLDEEKLILKWKNRFQCYICHKKKGENIIW